MKGKIHIILITCGVILLIIFVIITNVYGISTKNSMLELVPLLASIPIWIGLYLKSNKMNNRKWGIRLKILSITFIVSFVLFCIVHMVIIM